ncbi:MAG: T9SS type A sorting domain-containing protein [Paludibacter sp.]|nr:T9SS type A sorting domain-containing protein [Paludibacter sp.]
MRKYILLFEMMFFSFLNAQQGTTIVLATFEDESTDLLYVNEPINFELSLFVSEPHIGINTKPDINTSSKSYVAINIPDADWDGNFGELKLKNPILVTESTRYLYFKAYRSIQPKPFRIAINDNYENDQNVVFFGLLAENDKWIECCADLGTFMGRELISLNFIFSCNWSEPRSGWGESTYMFDDFELRNYPQPTDPSSINNMQDEYIVLYPNPVKNILYISASEQSVPYQVSVFDIMGKKLLEQRVKKSLNVSNLKKGYYILKINETKSFQFIKE